MWTMKLFNKTVALLATLFSITMVASGCGSNSSAPGTGGINGTSVSPYGAGVIAPIAGGGGQIMFSGSNVYNSGVRVTGATAGFTPTGGVYGTGGVGSPGQLVLGGVNIPVGQAGTL